MALYSESNISSRLRQFQPTSTSRSNDWWWLGGWEATPDNSNMEVGNGLGKTDQCEVSGKLHNNGQNLQQKYNLRSRKVNDMVGNSKSNDVNFKCIETDESKANVQENEIMQNWFRVMRTVSQVTPLIWFLFLVVNHHDFIRTYTRCIKYLTLQCNIISFL